MLDELKGVYDAPEEPKNAMGKRFPEQTSTFFPIFPAQEETHVITFPGFFSRSVNSPLRRFK